VRPRLPTKSIHSASWTTFASASEQRLARLTEAGPTEAPSTEPTPETAWTGLCAFSSCSSTSPGVRGLAAGPVATTPSRRPVWTGVLAARRRWSPASHLVFGAALKRNARWSLRRPQSYYGHRAQQPPVLSPKAFDFSFSGWAGRGCPAVLVSRPV